MVIVGEFASLVGRPVLLEKAEDVKTKEKEIRDMQDVLCSLGYLRPKVN